jgi:uncharacterized protein (DUF488 family)
VAIADVRRFPRSRRHPHFNTEVLAASLPRYEWFEELGGRRRVVEGSPNDGWEVAAFQGYADHMATPEFAAGMERLEALAGSVPTAVMCAEAPWWRCHRRLVSDALLVRGWDVRHILPDGGLGSHELTEFAVVEGERLVYPAAQLRL